MARSRGAIRPPGVQPEVYRRVELSSSGAWGVRQPARCTIGCSHCRLDVDWVEYLKHSLCWGPTRAGAAWPESVCRRIRIRSRSYPEYAQHPVAGIKSVASISDKGEQDPETKPATNRKGRSRRAEELNPNNLGSQSEQRRKKYRQRRRKPAADLSRKGFCEPSPDDAWRQTHIASVPTPTPPSLRSTRGVAHEGNLRSERRKYESVDFPTNQTDRRRKNIIYSWVKRPTEVGWMPFMHSIRSTVTSPCPAFAKTLAPLF